MGVVKNSANADDGLTQVLGQSHWREHQLLWSTPRVDYLVCFINYS
jgi:hypothetical protein